MTTLQQVELQCPICETRFRSQSVVSTNSFGGKRTDFHERAAGTQPLPYLIHTCNRCGYSGADRDFTEDAEVSPVLKERVWNELAPCITCGTLTGSEKYEAAAKVAEWQGMEAASRRRPAAARCVVLCGRRRRRSRAILPAQGGVEVRGSAGQLRRGGARRASGADVSGRRAVAARRGHDAGDAWFDRVVVGNRGLADAAVGDRCGAHSSETVRGVVRLSRRAQSIAFRTAGRRHRQVRAGCTRSR